MSENPYDRESTLAEEWCLLLSVDAASDDQNFFLLGGDSLIAMELAARFESRTALEFPLESLFSDGTYGALRQAVIAA